MLVPTHGRHRPSLCAYRSPTSPTAPAIAARRALECTPSTLALCLRLLSSRCPETGQPTCGRYTQASFRFVWSPVVHEHSASKPLEFQGVCGNAACQKRLKRHDKYCLAKDGKGAYLHVCEQCAQSGQFDVIPAPALEW